MLEERRDRRHAPTPVDVVDAGSVVAIRYEGDDDAERYLVGSIEERRDDIDASSRPARRSARPSLGHRPATTVEYDGPGGTLKVEIVEVGA